MDQKVILAIVAIIVIAIIAAFAFMNTGSNSSQVTDQTTKAAFTNNGTSWIHFVAIFGNVTFKNGTVGNIYADVWLNLNGGNATIDLSQLAGYGDQPLPAGTTINMLAYKNVLRPQSGGTDTLKLMIQSWSNALNPPSNVQPFNAEFPGMTIIQLPAGINDSQVNTTLDSTQAATWLAALSNANGTMVLEEESFTVNADGTVTVTAVRPPELCNLIAGI